MKRFDSASVGSPPFPSHITRILVLVNFYCISPWEIQAFAIAETIINLTAPMKTCETAMEKNFKARRLKGSGGLAMLGNRRAYRRQVRLPKGFSIYRLRLRSNDIFTVTVRSPERVLGTTLEQFTPENCADNREKNCTHNHDSSITTNIRCE